MSIGFKAWQLQDRFLLIPVELKKETRYYAKACQIYSTCIMFGILAEALHVCGECLNAQMKKIDGQTAHELILETENCDGRNENKRGKHHDEYISQKDPKTIRT